jgi:hypothetical protein
VDKYTFQVKIKKPLYVFIYKFADCRIACAVAREVAEKYGDDIGAHPVGTGLSALRSGSAARRWCSSATPTTTRIAGTRRSRRRSARRGVRADARQAPADDRPVEVSIIEETQPRWLSFLNEEMDLIFLVPEDSPTRRFPTTSSRRTSSGAASAWSKPPRST